MKKIRLGIVGMGGMGTNHARSVVSGKCSDFELVAVAESQSQRHQAIREEFGEQVRIFRSLDEMLTNRGVEACIVATPHYDHPAQTIACLEHGVHVLTEKPAGVYTAQVREMNAAAQAHPELVFAMMFNQRTNPIYRKIYELAHSGQFGQIRRVNWIITDWYRPQAYYDSGAWRATWAGEGGGVLLNQCPHQLDLLQWICGMPVLVDAHLHYGRWHNIEVEDDVTAYLEYANGATGVFITSTGDACGTNRLEIQLDKAKIVTDSVRLEVMEFEMTEQEFSRQNRIPFGGLPVHPLEFELSEDYSRHPGVINAFGGAILRGEPLVADGSEGINGLMLSNAMHLSSWLGRPVELPFDEALFHQELIRHGGRKR